jgi:hypothetical protein
LDKKQADKVIIGYLEKKFGFALSKTTNIDKTEEYASLISLMSISLLKKDNVYNNNSYLYKVVHNVYARFVND